MGPEIMFFRHLLALFIIIYIDLFAITIFITRLKSVFGSIYYVYWEEVVLPVQPNICRPCKTVTWERVVSWIPIVLKSDPVINPVQWSGHGSNELTRVNQKKLIGLINLLKWLVSKAYIFFKINLLIFVKGK